MEKLVKQLQQEVEILKKRLGEYDSIIGHNIDEKIKARDIELNRLRLLNTPMKNRTIIKRLGSLWSNIWK